MSRLSKLAAALVISTTAAFGGASIALADGYAAKQVAYERPADWSGFYFGVSSGYQWSSIDLTSAPGGTTVGVDDSDMVMGAHMGIQHQFGAIVLGVEGGWTSTGRNDWGSTNCPVALECRGRLNDILTIGPRIGWAAGHWMPYITGGYASGRFAHERWSLPGAGGAQTLQDSASTRNQGWYIGTGFEWIVSPGWTTGLEYRHYAFDSESGPAFTPVGVLVTANRIIDPQSTDVISARVSWRWGREPVAAPLK